MVWTCPRPSPGPLPSPLPPSGRGDLWQLEGRAPAAFGHAPLRLSFVLGSRPFRLAKGAGVVVVWFVSVVGGVLVLGLARASPCSLRSRPPSRAKGGEIPRCARNDRSGCSE